eukprot:691209-Amphidinium_carterae.1
MCKLLRCLRCLSLGQDDTVDSQGEAFPARFLEAWAERYEIVLQPGDVLRIPALWAHCTEDVQGHERLHETAQASGAPVSRSHSIGISVNIFYKTKDLQPFYANKDAWCNADYVPYRDGSKLVDKALAEVRLLPSRAKEFYLLRLRAKIDDELCRMDPDRESTPRKRGCLIERPHVALNGRVRSAETLCEKCCN